MGYCMVTSFYLNLLTILQKLFRAKSPRFGLAIRELPSDFQTHFVFSKHSVLFPRLIYRCFITLFSTSIFDGNFESYCSRKFISCVLKSENILLI